MANRFMTLLLAIEKRLAVLDGEHEHRTGLGLARSHPPALAGLVPAPKTIMAAGTWVDNLAAQIVTTTEALLPGLSGVLRPGAKAKSDVGGRRNWP